MIYITDYEKIIGCSQKKVNKTIHILIQS